MQGVALEFSGCRIVNWRNNHLQSILRNKFIRPDIGPAGAGLAINILCNICQGLRLTYNLLYRHRY